MNQPTNTPANPAALADALGAVMTREPDGAIVVADPFDPAVHHDSPDALIRSMHERLVARRRQFDALGDLAAASTGDLAAFAKAVKEDDDALLDFGNRLNEAAIATLGLKAVVVQMRGAKSRIDPASVRGRFAEMVKACKAEIDRATPPPPRHTYVVRLTCDDATLTKLLKGAEKSGAEGIACAAPQSDAAVRKIERWFEENM